MSSLNRPGDCDSRHLRVAVIDDNPLVLGLIREMLERADREVVTFLTPQAALTALAEGGFDVVLCDIHMPGMSGIEFYQRLQSNDPSNGDRVIFLTGDRFGPETERFFASTQCSCLCKPFRRADLERAIDRMGALSEISAEPEHLRKAA